MTFRLPTSVVPTGSSGILVFAWVVLSGQNPPFAYWHFGVNAGAAKPDWFSMLIAADPKGSVTCNSQAFWLPMPVDGNVTVSLFYNDLPSKANRGQVEIHGYYPGADAP